MSKKEKVPYLTDLEAGLVGHFLSEARDAFTPLFLDLEREILSFEITYHRRGRTHIVHQISLHENQTTSIKTKPYHHAESWHREPIQREQWILCLHVSFLGSTLNFHHYLLSKIMGCIMKTIFGKSRRKTSSLQWL